MATDTAEEKAIETPPVAAKDAAIGSLGEEEHLTKLREDAEIAVKRVAGRDEKFIQRLERRHAVREPEDVSNAAEVRKQEAQRLADQEQAANEAAERASKWVAPEPIKGRMKGVEIVLHPEEKVRKHTIQIRALGEVQDGFIMVFEEPIDKNDLKQGRVAESPRFGTKNRVRVTETDPKTGLADIGSEVTHPGYMDFGPLRLNPGKYRAVVVDMDDEILAEEAFEIALDTTGDGRSDQVKTKKELGTESRRGAVMDPGRAEELRAAKQAQMAAHQAAKAAGDTDSKPPKPTTGAPGPSAAEKKARKESPEGRAK